MMMCAQIYQKKAKFKDPGRLPRRVAAALSDFQNRILELFPGEINQVILFGSFARGEAKADSDVDVMVVVNWLDPDREDGYYLDNLVDPRWLSILEEALLTLLRHPGVLISPVVIGDRLFQSNLSLAKEVRQEGIVLWKNKLT